MYIKSYSINSVERKVYLHYFTLFWWKNIHYTPIRVKQFNV